MPPWRRGITLFLLLLLVGAVAGVAWWLRPAALPEAEIEARWRASPWLPTALEAEPGPAVFRGLSEPVPEERLDALLDWFAEDGRLPPTGCIALRENASYTPLQVFTAGKALSAAGFPDVAADLGEQLRGRELLSLMVGAALAEIAAEAGVKEPVPTSEELFESLAYEAACMDKLTTSLIDGNGPAPEGLERVNLPRERLLLRDHYGRLLAALHPVRHDPAAMRQVLEAHESGLDGSAVGALLGDTTVDLALRYLSELPDAR